MARTTTIVVAGDRAFALRLRALAALRGEEISVMVRRALDAHYGEQLAKVPDASLFADGVASTQSKSANGTRNGK